MDKQDKDKKFSKLILVTGSDGIVGSCFVKNSEHRDSFHTPKSIELNITDKAEIKAVLSSYDFQAVVNFAAETSTVKGEEERGDKTGTFWQVNVEGVRNLTNAILEINPAIHFIQLSTSKVFSGSKDDKGPYDEKHPPESNPEKLSWYGFTKKCAEDTVLATLKETATIVRLSHVVNGESDSEHEFLNKLLGWYKNDGSIFADQFLTLTDIDDVVKTLDLIIDKSLKGTYHIASGDITTPSEILKYIIEKTGNTNGRFQEISLNDYLKQKSGLGSYVYPKYGGLIAEKTQRAVGLQYNDWKEVADKYINKKRNYLSSLIK